MVKHLYFFCLFFLHLSAVFTSKIFSKFLGQKLENLLPQILHKNGKSDTKKFTERKEINV